MGRIRFAIVHNPSGLRSRASPLHHFNLKRGIVESLAHGSGCFVSVSGFANPAAFAGDLISNIQFNGAGGLPILH
jgi:hypothetical protein